MWVGGGAFGHVCREAREENRRGGNGWVGRCMACGGVCRGARVGRGGLKMGVEGGVRWGWVGCSDCAWWKVGGRPMDAPSGP